MCLKPLGDIHKRMRTSTHRSLKHSVATMYACHANNAAATKIQTSSAAMAASVSALSAMAVKRRRRNCGIWRSRVTRPRSCGANVQSARTSSSTLASGGEVTDVGEVVPRATSPVPAASGSEKLIPKSESVRKVGKVTGGVASVRIRGGKPVRRGE